MEFDPNAHRKAVKTAAGDVNCYSLPSLGDTSHLPYSIRILLESALRNNDGFKVTDEDVRRLLGWSPQTAGTEEIVATVERLARPGASAGS